MEQLIKELKELGYELQYYEPMKSWRVVDIIVPDNDFLTSSFARVVFKNGFIFSCGITMDGKGLCVNFKKL